ncbi:unnamed protein product [Amoebophrya sp. A25]|nr:unnamed protein product [Amoebophrya sp. A25]|eukprot:GSA25T00020558001.1
MPVLGLLKAAAGSAAILNESVAPQYTADVVRLPSYIGEVRIPHLHEPQLEDLREVHEDSAASSNDYLPQYSALQISAKRSPRFWHMRSEGHGLFPREHDDIEKIPPRSIVEGTVVGGDPCCVTCGTGDHSLDDESPIIKLTRRKSLERLSLLQDPDDLMGLHALLDEQGEEDQEVVTFDPWFGDNETSSGTRTRSLSPASRSPGTSSSKSTFLRTGPQGDRDFSSSSPKNKYYSIDHAHGFCGETCLYDWQYPILKVFEPGLTKVSSDEGGRTARICAEKGYSQYSETVTHGAGPIKVTLDLYAPTALGDRTSKQVVNKHVLNGEASTSSNGTRSTRTVSVLDKDLQIY